MPEGIDVMPGFSSAGGLDGHPLLLRRALAEHRPEARWAADPLAAYLDELALWAARSSITGFATAADRVERGVLDCLPVADVLEREARLVDVGSGNGLPGIVAAVLRPDVAVTLVEPSARRAAFLRSAASRAGTANVAVERCRAQDLDVDEPFDAAVSRAVFPPARWLEVAEGLVRPGGAVLVMMGRDEPPEPPGRLTLVDVLPHPAGGGIVRRKLVRYEKGRRR
jgi:16S rRNA (guanine527-N7)-methyltransferase